MSFRSWVTWLTFVLLIVIIFFAWDEIVKAWNLLDSVNIWILALIVPIQFISYYAVGETIFSYLRSKGNLENVSRLAVARMALELNFVNHVLPSGGAAGFSYMGWALKRHGVSAGRSTMAQIIRFVLAFLSFVIILLVSVFLLILDNKIQRGIIALSVFLVFLIVVGVAFLIYIIGNHKRLITISGWLTKNVNKIVKKITFGRKSQILKLEIVEDFFTDLHQDYIEIIRDKKILIKPLLWSTLAVIMDALLIFIAFLSLGDFINPAAIFVAFGMSAAVSLFSVTPGGAGVYEAVMIAFLVSSGVSANVAIAGTLLARVVLVLLTIIFGYVFYQLTINKHGKIN